MSIPDSAKLDRYDDLVSLVEKLHDENMIQRRLADSLAEKWDDLARRKFSDAERDPSEFGRRFIEHGAVCYSNCALALRELFGINGR